MKTQQKLTNQTLEIWKSKKSENNLSLRVRGILIDRSEGGTEKKGGMKKGK